MFAFLHREAETTIGSDQTQVCRVMLEAVGLKYVLAFIAVDCKLKGWFIFPV